MIFAHYSPAIASENAKTEGAAAAISSKTERNLLDKDIAFFSVMGSRPDAKTLRGFQKAVLYNAQGAKVKEITFNKSDSIYSLDKMLQENSTRGPLFIRMYR